MPQARRTASEPQPTTHASDPSSPTIGEPVVVSLEEDQPITATAASATRRAMIWPGRMRSLSRMKASSVPNAG